jgi:hypothetical protein
VIGGQVPRHKSGLIVGRHAHPHSARQFGASSFVFRERWCHETSPPQVFASGSGGRRPSSGVGDCKGTGLSVAPDRRSFAALIDKLLADYLVKHGVLEKVTAGAAATRRDRIECRRTGATDVDAEHTLPRMARRHHDGDRRCNTLGGCDLSGAGIGTATLSVRAQ